MELKYLEWNLRAMGGVGGYAIPSFVSECIFNADVDIFVLVEFRCDDGWEQFKNNLKDYDLYCSPYVQEGYNQVCIGIRKKIYNLKSIFTVNACDVDIPEFLQVDVSIGGSALSIIGTRIKTQADEGQEESQEEKVHKKKQMEYLREHLKGLETVLCLGDFNCTSSTLVEYFKGDKDVGIYGPRVVWGYYSYVFEEDKNNDNGYNSNKCGLDWVLVKGIEEENVYNGDSDKKKSPYATYDWSFIDAYPRRYNGKKKDEYLGIKGMPDHAILKGMITLEKQETKNNDNKEWVMPTHIVAAAGIVTNEKEEVLLVKTHNAGWVFPGGQVEVGETVPGAVVREIMEESGIAVEVGELFCVSSNVGKHSGYNGVKEVPTKVVLDFVCKAVGGKLRTSEENSETAWFSKEDALGQIKTPAIIERYKAYLEYDGRPTYMAYVTKPEFELKEKRKL